MDDLKPRAAALHADALVWDAHACLPLHPDADIGALERHRANGVDFVSINIGMDMNPLPQIMAVIASFRAQLSARSDRFVQVDGASDVLRAKSEEKLAVAFDLGGGVPLGERPEMVQLFYDLGVRQIHLAYNRNNSIGGGCYDDDIPLSALGRRIVAAINEAGMLMDCSHTGYRTSLDIMAASAAPVVYSHANPLALADNGRNIRDDQIDACVATGGVVCVNGVGRFLGDPEAGTAAILRHIDYLVQRIGAERVGLGIDYVYDLGLNEDPPGLDRARWWPPEHGYGKAGPRIKIAAPEQFPEITAGLLGLGYAEADVRKILVRTCWAWRSGSGGRARPTLSRRERRPKDRSEPAKSDSGGFSGRRSDQRTALSEPRISLSQGVTAFTDNGRIPSDHSKIATNSIGLLGAGADRRGPGDADRITGRTDLKRNRQWRRSEDAGFPGSDRPRSAGARAPVHSGLSQPQTEGSQRCHHHRWRPQGQLGRQDRGVHGRRD